MSHFHRSPSSLARAAGRFALVAALALLLVASGLLLADPRASAAAAPRDERDVLASRLAEMLEAVEEYHVGAEDVDGTHLVHGAIRGMLDTLDPHTHFLDAESYRTMKESQDGSFFGLGIIISVRRDRNGKGRLTVISPIDGMPAKRLGMRAGDIIAGIDGESTDGLTLDGAVAKLRGEKGTAVRITVERGAESFDLDVERAEIPTESVQHAFMIRPGVGFVRVKDFTKTTTTELEEAVADLRAQGMTRMILDLRDNPGGLLDQAVTVSSVFLESSDLVVETRGRVSGANEVHPAVVRSGHLPADTSLIVLVNRGSASASEIVSGAIQDHDRGLIVGTTTWGKGLVQSVYNLSSESGLALTTARYYTPSGRQIQRDYRSSYFDYYFPRKGESPHGEKHVTDGGRAVYSGGGIEPDVRVEPHELHALAGRLIRRSAFFRFANRAFTPPPKRIDAGFSASDADLAAFRQFLDAEGIEIDAGEWSEALPDLRHQLTYEIVSAHGDIKEAFKAQCEADPQVQAALELWPHATRPAILADAAGGTTPVFDAQVETEEERRRVIAEVDTTPRPDGARREIVVE